MASLSFLLSALCLFVICSHGLALKDLLNDAIHSSNETECIQALKETLRAAKNFEMWALSMIDAAGRFNMGMFMGKRVLMGEPETCMAITHPDGKYIGQHCLFDINITSLSSFLDIGLTYTKRRPMSMALRDICVPSVCSAKELVKIFQSVRFGNLSLGEQFEIEPSDPNACVTRLTVNPYDAYDYMFLIMVGIAVFSMVFGTIYECHYKFNLKTETPNEYLCAFSLYKNGRKLFVVPDMDKFGIMHFLKATSMFGIVLGHTALESLIGRSLNANEMLESMAANKYVPFHNTHNTCDTFFVMGAMLLVVSFYKELKRNGYYDFPLALLKRYVRLTPTSFVVVSFILTLRRHIANVGAYRSIYTSTRTACLKQFPYILLYVHNYVENDYKCFVEAWYMDADMQLFLLAPLLLYPVLKIRSWAVVSLILSLVGASLEFSAGLKYDLGPVVTYSKHFIHFEKLHFLTHLRSSPYFLGLFFGFFYAKILAEGDKFKLSKRTNIALWILAGIPFMLSQITLLFFDLNYTQPAGAIFLSYRRLFWAAGIAWMIVACTTGHGGFIQKISRWKPWYFFSTISFCVYITHLHVIELHQSAAVDNKYSSFLELFFAFLQYACISLITGTLLAISVEMPVANLAFLIFKNKKIFPYPRNQKKSEAKAELASCEYTPQVDNVSDNVTTKI